MIKKFRELNDKFDITYFASVLALLFMGTIHLVIAIKDKSNYALSYAIFYYIMTFARLLIWCSFKLRRIKYVYLTTALVLLISLVPLVETIMLKIDNNETMYLIYDWFIYVYALYAFIKISFAIYNLIRRNTESRKMLAFISIISAVFTMFMLEFTLIRMFGELNKTEYIIEMIFILGILLLVIFEVIFFLIKFRFHLKYIKEIEKSQRDLSQ